jgi:hypothetical protein
MKYSKFSPNQRQEGRLMRISRIACILAVLILPPFVLAKLPVPIEILGKVEGALDFCAEANPTSADRYQAKKKEFSQGATDEELGEARASQEYKDGYQSATVEISKQPKDEAKKSCAAALAGK